MRRSTAAGLGAMFVVWVIALTGAPVGAIEKPAIFPSLPRNITKVQLSCRKWVSICLKRWGPSSPKYGQCLRNHGCGAA
jgi:hypothetical protein